MNIRNSIFIFFTLFYILDSLSAQDYTECQPEAECLQDCKPKCPQHLFYVGPEAYYMRRVKEGGTKQHGVLGGVRAGYDRIKRYGLYWGIEGYYATGTLRGKSATNAKLVSRVQDSEIEGRIGYTFNRKTGFSAFFTPFGGYGYFCQRNNFRHPSPIHLHFRDHFQYAVAGFLSSLFINPCLSVGANFKVKFMIDGKSQIGNDPKFENSTLLMNNKEQYSLDLPINYAVCFQEHIFDLSFVPFFQYRHYGGRENYPFDFIDTKFWVYGGRLLLYSSF